MTSSEQARADAMADAEEGGEVMRAFISDQKARDRALGLNGSDSALAEARRILAETEPERNSAHLTLEDYRTGSVPLARLALADALRAFVATSVTEVTNVHAKYIDPPELRGLPLLPTAVTGKDQTEDDE